MKNDNTSPNFRDYLLQKGLSTNTIESYKKDVEKFMKWSKQENQPVENMRQGDILSYVQIKKISNSQRSISLMVNSLKHYFNYLIAIGILSENPVIQIQIKGVKRRSLYHILSKEELENLYENFGTTEKSASSEPRKGENQNWFKSSELVSKRNKVILGLIIYQGLGTAELNRLEETDLKLREGKVFITGTRRSNERLLKLESHQVMDIMEYQFTSRKEILEIGKKESNKLIVSTGKSENITNLISVLIKKLRRQNKKVQSIKQIRASVITHWLKKYNLREAQYMAGHRYVSSTEAYLINDLEDLSEAIDKHHPLFSEAD